MQKYLSTEINKCSDTGTESMVWISKVQKVKNFGEVINKINIDSHELNIKKNRNNINKNGEVYSSKTHCLNTIEALNESNSKKIPFQRCKVF